MNENSPAPVTPVVEIFNGSLFTTSLNVADVYSKAHRHVLRDIENLKAVCPQDFTESNFGLSEYTDPTGRKLPMYRLSRDGLVLLVMGYTGPKAMEHKIGYINAFNAMEAKLKDGASKELTLEMLQANPRAIGQLLIDYADTKERLALEVARADEAVRTKAEIGSRREATAMATASAAVRKNTKLTVENEALKDERGKGENFKAVKNIPWITQEFNVSLPGTWSQIGKKLSKVTKSMGLEAHVVEDSEYNIKAYPLKAIEEFKRLLENDPDFLKPYRK